MDAARQARMAVAAGLGVVQRFQRRCRAAENHRDAEALRAHYQQIARRITQPLLLLVGAVVLLVDDDQAQIAKRQERRRARADHHRRQTGARAQPGLRAFGLRHGRVVAGDVRAEAPREAFAQLRRQTDFRRQHQHLLASSDHVSGAPQVQLGLAAAGDPLQQGDREFSLRVAAQDVQRCCLFGRQFRRRFAGGDGGGCRVQCVTLDPIFL